MRRVIPPYKGWQQQQQQQWGDPTNDYSWTSSGSDEQHYDLHPDSSNPSLPPPHPLPDSLPHYSRSIRGASNPRLQPSSSSSSSSKFLDVLSTTTSNFLDLWAEDEGGGGGGSERRGGGGGGVRGGGGGFPRKNALGEEEDGLFLLQHLRQGAPGASDAFLINSTTTSSSSTALQLLDSFCDEEQDPFCMFSAAIAPFPGGVDFNNDSAGAGLVVGDGDPFYNDSDGFFENETSFKFFPEKCCRYWALILALFPVVTVFGNVLVVMSVFREKSLKTVTNYFICSLAVADIMVAVVVMPFAVYLEVVDGWYLSDSLCDAWVACDVMACTASILNLTAISVDRFIAVTQPIKYAKHKNSKRVYVMIAFTWLLSAAIAMPITLGVNYSPDRNVGDCAFYNADFIIYSSMGSFYIPSVIMILLYSKIYRVIHLRALKAQAAKETRATRVVMNNVIENVGATAGGRGRGGGGGHPQATVTTSLAGGGLDANGQVSYNTTCTLSSVAQQHHRNFLQAHLLPPIEDTSFSYMGSDTGSDWDSYSYYDYEHKSSSPSCGKAKDVPPAAAVTDASSEVDIVSPGCSPYQELGTVGAELYSNPGAPAAEQMEKRAVEGTASSIDVSSSTTTTTTTSTTNPADSQKNVETVDVKSGERGKNGEEEKKLHSPAPLSPSFAVKTNIASSEMEEGGGVDGAEGAGEGGGAGGGAGGGGGGGGGIAGTFQNNGSADMRVCTANESDLDSSSRRKKIISKFHFHKRTSRKRQEKSSSRKEKKATKTLAIVLGLSSLISLASICTNRKRQENSSSCKEKKATKTLAIVLGVFLLCWVPFFTVNIINAICIRYSLMRYPVCNPSKLLFSFFVWLGYINSFLNPVIYTIFNPEFRKAFRNILTHPCSKVNQTMEMRRSDFPSVASTMGTAMTQV